MAKYERGCTEYVTVSLELEISFPKDKVVCDLCEFCHTENSGTRFRCQRTGEILPFHNVDYGRRCPLFKDNPISKNESEVDEND